MKVEELGVDTQREKDAKGLCLCAAMICSKEEK